jgi:hypothetical protein
MRKHVYAALAVTFAVALSAGLPLRAFNESIDYDGINKISSRASSRPTRRSWKP